MAQGIKIGIRRTNSRVYTLAAMLNRRGKAVLVPLAMGHYSRNRYSPHTGEKQLIKAMRKEGSKYTIDILLDDGEGWRWQE